MGEGGTVYKIKNSKLEETTKPRQKINVKIIVVFTSTTFVQISTEEE